ncbi:hypothetical protein BN2127_JRS10_03687 [Bacillus subtilis]|nr:hypothetical protein BN2127_JRS10_03687 [Bacillus subtilis]
MMVKSKRKKQFDFVGKMALSMMGGFLTSYIALDLLSDEPRKLSSNTFIGDIVTQAWFVYAVITCRRALLQGTDVSFAVWNLVASIACLTTVVIIGLITKNRYNKLYPEQGVTYMESMKMWTKNADEGLKHIVHEAGYKAYEFTNTILAYVWWAAVIYTVASDIDFVLIGLISFIWILHLGKFMYEMHRKMIY